MKIQKPAAAAGPAGLLQFNIILRLAALVYMTFAFFSCVACVSDTRILRQDSFSVLGGESNKKSHKGRDSDQMVDPRMKTLSDSIQKTIRAQSSKTHAKSRQVINADVLEEKDHSVASLHEEVKKDPGNAELRFNLASLYHRYLIFDKACIEYQKAIQLNSDIASYHEALGRLWRDWGAHQAGISELSKALQLDPSSIQSLNTLGTIYDALGNLDKARECYLKALQLNPDLPFIHSNLCFNYLQSGAVDEAILHGETAARLSPGSEVAHNNLGLAYGMVGNFIRALEHFKLAGTEATAHNNLGILLLENQRIEEAMEQFRIAAKLRPAYRLAAKNYYYARKLHMERSKHLKTGHNESTSGGIEVSESFASPELNLKLISRGFEFLSSEMTATAGHSLRPL